MKMSDIHIGKKDLPSSFPPDSDSYELLKKSLHKNGMLNPVFVNADGVLLQGHYRFWAWEELGKTHIQAVVVEDEKEIGHYFL